jgi:hypothetical protein
VVSELLMRLRTTAAMVLLGVTRFSLPLEANIVCVGALARSNVA